MKNRINKTPILILALSIALTSCKKNEGSSASETADYNNGIFISNEGAFGSGYGTISFYNRTSKSVIADIFKIANGSELGNVVNSIEVFNDRAFVVENNAHKTEVVNLKDFHLLGTITGLNQPRYFIGINENKGMISEWGDGSGGYVKIINLLNYTVERTDTTGAGAEHMLLTGNYVYVCNAGGYDASYNPVNDSAVAFINATTNNMEGRIQVGYNPSGIVQDKFGKLWVMCSGITDYNVPANNRPASLVRIDTATKTADLTLPLATNGTRQKITLNAVHDILYYNIGGSIYQQDVSQSTLNTVAVINRDFYSLGLDPVSGYIFGADPKDYASDGWIIRYQTTGALIDSFQVGIIPGNFYFH